MKLKLVASVAVFALLCSSLAAYSQQPTSAISSAKESILAAAQALQGIPSPPTNEPLLRQAVAQLNLAIVLYEKAQSLSASGNLSGAITYATEATSAAQSAEALSTNLGQSSTQANEFRTILVWTLVPLEALVSALVVGWATVQWSRHERNKMLGMKVRRRDSP